MYQYGSVCFSLCSTVIVGFDPSSQSDTNDKTYGGENRSCNVPIFLLPHVVINHRECQDIQLHLYGYGPHTVITIRPT